MTYQETCWFSLGLPQFSLQYPSFTNVNIEKLSNTTPEKRGQQVQPDLDTPILWADTRSLKNQSKNWPEITNSHKFPMVNSHPLN